MTTETNNETTTTGSAANANPKIANRRNKEERKILAEFFQKPEIADLIEKKPKDYIETIRAKVENETGLKMSKVAIYHRLRVMKDKAQAKADADSIHNMQDVALKYIFGKHVDKWADIVPMISKINDDILIDWHQNIWLADGEDRVAALTSKIDEIISKDSV